MIERKKDHVLKEFLPAKNEKVVMCELSNMQRQVYEQILHLPEIDYVRKASSPCDCGVNRGFFQHLHRLQLQSERVAYVRQQQNNLVKRRECCYEVPLNPDYVEGGTEPRIHPDAVIWRSMKGHAGDEPCDTCPFCCGFPVLAKLYVSAFRLYFPAICCPSHQSPLRCVAGTS
jgi:SNF2 family DNA or RNA helicase